VIACWCEGAGGIQSEADLVLVAAGVAPNARLAVDAGIETGEKGAIRVDRSMRTNVADVFAAGDCVETWHRVLQSSTYLPLGTTAHKQGRVAGENAVGGRRLFQGSLGTQVVKVFDIAISRTGLRDHEARRAGFDPLTVETEVSDHKAHYPGAQQLRIRVTGDHRSGRLLGAQILGRWQSEVAKRIDVYAAALFTDVSVDAINDLDLSYTPPLGSPWDAVQLAAQPWTAAVKGGPS
jgi:NADPH-dependent 2,4-dienoyl-CoA reductase/sulfur reductase-like enzyme